MFYIDKIILIVTFRYGYQKNMSMYKTMSGIILIDSVNFKNYEGNM